MDNGRPEDRQVRRQDISLEAACRSDYGVSRGYDGKGNVELYWGYAEDGLWSAYMRCGCAITWADVHAA